MKGTGGRFQGVLFSIGTLGIRWGSRPRTGTIILAIVIRIYAVVLAIVI
jgi:hypothetical protein